MRKDMKKLLILGTKDSHDRFFRKAQEMGWMQFISVTGKKLHEDPKEVQDLKSALRVLRKQPVKKQESFPEGDADKIVGEVLTLKRDIENNHETIRLINAEITKVSPLGHFSMESVERISSETGKRIQFFLIRHERVEEIGVPEGLIHIKREYDFDYFMYVGDGPMQNPSFTEVYVRKDLGNLLQDKEELERNGHEMEARLKSLAIYMDFLIEVIFNKTNMVNLEFAKEEVDYLLDDSLFVVEAWIPKHKMELIDPVVRDLSLIVKQVKIEKDDKVPTYLENKGFNKVGEDLLDVFDTPDITDKDPSGWVIWFFAIFFGMIISDAAYGCLFLLASLFFWITKPNLKGIKRRILKMFTLLSCTTIIWGVMVASYFSINLKPDNPLNKYSVIYQIAKKQVDYHIIHKTADYKEWLEQYPSLIGVEDPKAFIDGGTIQKEGSTVYQLMSDVYGSILMEIALFVGVFHLSLSFLRNLYRSWGGIGWVIAMWGAYMFFPKVLDATSLIHYLGLISKETGTILGQQLLYGGMGLAVLLSIIQEGFGGIAALFKVIEIFADVLSYLRLYALGLASMVLAATFNELGREVGNYLFGALIILFGHTVNISLGTMAGVIHGLRLNFLEWFHHSFEGSGYKFSPLRRLVHE